MDPERLKRIEAGHKQAALVCAAITLILPMLAFVTFVMLSTTEGERPSSDPIITIVFGFMVILELGVAVWLREWMYRVIMRPPPATGGLAAGPINEALAAVDPIDRAIAALPMWGITIFALGEIPILLGFVHTIQGGSLPVFGAFIMVGLAIWYLNFPRKARWIAFVDAEEAKAAGYTDIVH